MCCVDHDYKSTPTVKTQMRGGLAGNMRKMWEQCLGSPVRPQTASNFHYQERRVAPKWYVSISSRRSRYVVFFFASASVTIAFVATKQLCISAIRTNTPCGARLVFWRWGSSGMGASALLLAAVKWALTGSARTECETSTQQLLLCCFFLHTPRTRRSPASHQCLQRAGLLAISLPQKKSVALLKKNPESTCRTDGASPDLSLISDGIRFLLRMV